MPHEQDILLNTRTVRANPIMRWLLWNMPYHTAHHCYPMVPFHKLPALHDETGNSVPVRTTRCCFFVNWARRLMQLPMLSVRSCRIGLPRR